MANELARSVVVPNVLTKADVRPRFHMAPSTWEDLGQMTVTPDGVQVIDWKGPSCSSLCWCKRGK